MHVGADALFTQFSEEHTTLFRGNMVNIEMEGTTSLGAEITREPVWGQCFEVVPSELTTLMNPCV